MNQAKIPKPLLLASKSGQSVIEVIVAVAILVIIAASSVTVVLGSFSTTRLAEEETQAALLAVEGLEATQSIRNQNWANLTNGSHGLLFSGGNWTFNGSSDIDPTNTFTRTTTIAEVQRDGNGDIVGSGGTVDVDTKKTTVDVTWNFTPTRQNTVSMTSYLTNWQKSKGNIGGSGGGIQTCDEYCLDLGYSAGTCRQSSNKCTQNGETYEAGGDLYCIGPSASACCCAP